MRSLLVVRRACNTARKRSSTSVLIGVCVAALCAFLVIQTSTAQAIYLPSHTIRYVARGKLFNYYIRHDFATRYRLIVCGRYSSHSGYCFGDVQGDSFECDFDYSSCWTKTTDCDVTVRAAANVFGRVRATIGNVDCHSYQHDFI